MPVPMIERMLQGVSLTEAEAAAARATLQAKMERRGRLRQQALALGELGRGGAGQEAELARAIQEFEGAVAEYQQQMARLDRELGAQVSAKAKAQLLAAGVFENGIGLPGPGPGPGGGPGNGPPLFGGGDGPWNHRVLLATSRDGMTWSVRDEALAERASVPELFAGPDGRAIVLFVDADAGGLGALRERADGSWERCRTNLGGVDPNVVPLEEGVRVSAPAQGPARLGVADPAPLQRADGTWLMAVKSFIGPSPMGPPPGPGPAPFPRP